MFYCILLIFLKKKWQEALVKFVNVREKKVFSPKFASQAGEIKEKIHPTGGSETKVFFMLASASHFLPQSTVSRRSDSSSEANLSCCHIPHAWSHLE